MNFHTSSLSSLDNGYIFLFLGTNLSFISIVWSYIFLVGILSDCFFSKHINLLMKAFWYQFLYLLFQLCHFFFLIPNFPFFCYLLYLYYSFFLQFFFFFSFSFCSFSSYFLPSSSVILTSLTLTSTVFRTLLSFFCSPVNFRIMVSKL